MKKIISLIFLFSLILTPLLPANGAELSSTLKGKILLQVEGDGQAWYIDPTTEQRAFLGRPDDAFRIMRELGLGISEKDYNVFKEGAPEKLSGKFY